MDTNLIAYAAQGGVHWNLAQDSFTRWNIKKAVSLVVDGGLTVAEVGRRLSISQQTLQNWIKKYRSTGLKANGSHSASELEAGVPNYAKS